MADLAKVIDKIRKLLALGSSPNEHEAAAAVAKAQEMLQSYDLTMESIGDLHADSRTSIRKGDAVINTVEGKPDGWKSDLMGSVALVFDCYTACQWTTETTPGGRYRTVKRWNLIGFGHDVEMASYAMGFLVGEIERLAQAYADTLWAEIRGYRDANGLTQHDAESAYVKITGRHPLKAKIYFIKGAASAVAEKLEHDHWVQQAATRKAERQAEADGTANPYAIVLSKRDAVDEWMFKDRHGKTRAEWEAEWEARRTAIVRPEPEPKVETDAQRRKREAREARANERYWEAKARAQARAEAAMDKEAHRAGTDAGANLSIRRGVSAGRTSAALDE